MTPTFVWPTDSRVVSSGFTDPRPYGQHNAIDIVANLGAWVEAVVAGRVIFTGWAGSAGLSVWIDHARGWRSHYCHLTSVACRVGHLVDQGQHIGDVGHSGDATGPHLHLNLFAPTKPATGLSAFVAWVGKWAVDPLDYLTEEDDMADPIVPPPRNYVPGDFPQPEFGAKWPAWTTAQHIQYIYRLIRRRELRLDALEAHLRRANTRD